MLDPDADPQQWYRGTTCVLSEEQKGKASPGAKNGHFLQGFYFLCSVFPIRSTPTQFWVRSPSAEHTYPLDFSVEDRYFSINFVELSVKARC
jgi:hypothetical protein